MAERPQPDRVQSLRVAYDGLYRGPVMHDSPERSRIELVRRIVRELSLVANPVVINLGSGPQILERQLVAYAHSRGQQDVRKRLATTRLVTVDVAHLPKLRAQNHAQHVQADSRFLPFRDGVADLVVSNHSLDMLRAEPGQFELALGGVARVLKPGGRMLVNYHPAVLYTTACAYFGADPEAPQADYYDSSRPNPFYASEKAIAADLSDAGLDVENVRYATVEPDAWWEVTAQKPVLV